MSLSCDFDQDEYESVIEPGIAQATHRCCECRAEIAPGHAELVVMMVPHHEDGPFDDLDEDQQHAMRDDEDTTHYHHCERCGDLVLSLWAMGFCTEFGGVWADYREWLTARSLAPRIAPIKYLPTRHRGFR